MKKEHSTISRLIINCLLPAFLLFSGCTLSRDLDLQEKGKLISDHFSTNEVRTLVEFFTRLGGQEKDSNTDGAGLILTVENYIKYGMDKEELSNLVGLLKTLLAESYFKKNREKLEAIVKIVKGEVTGHRTVPSDKSIATVKIAVAVLNYLPEDSIKKYVNDYFDKNRVKTIQGLVVDYTDYYKTQKGGLVGKSGTELFLNLKNGYTSGKRLYQRFQHTTEDMIVSGYNYIMGWKEEKCELVEHIQKNLEKGSTKHSEKFLYFIRKIRHNKKKEHFIKVLGAQDRTDQERIIEALDTAEAIAEKYTNKWFESVGTKDNKTQAIILKTILKLSTKRWMDDKISDQFQSFR